VKKKQHWQHCRWAQQLMDTFCSVSVPLQRQGKTSPTFPVGARFVTKSCASKSANKIRFLEIYDNNNNNNNNDILLRTHGSYHRHKNTKSG